jgi:hypothetical protein
MDPNTQRLLSSSGGAAERIYVEDVFSTWLYTGNGSTQTITNGIDLSGKGGLVWTKPRNAANTGEMVDTARGVNSRLDSTNTNAAATDCDVTGFNSNGYSLGFISGLANFNARTFASWTFRKSAKFFDVVTYTGNGSARAISHALGSAPGCVIVKRTDSTASWQVWHRSTTQTNQFAGYLNSTSAFGATGDALWGASTSGTPDMNANTISIGTSTVVNASGGTYVAYLFAHDAGGFGDSGNESIIKCGSYTTPSSGSVSVDLGWEPQWVLFKSSSNEQSWRIIDNMRGFYAVSQNSRELLPNTSGIEADTQLELTATGFSASASAWGASRTFIYIAIRRGPMKTPTDATKVFNATIDTTASPTTTFNVGFPADLFLVGFRTGGISQRTHTRLTGGGYLETGATGAEASTTVGWDKQNSLTISSGNGLSLVDYFFRRAPGFFDVVAYTGTGSARTVSHNLGVVPELMIVKKRSAADNWVVYAGDATDYLILNTTAATADLDTMWNDTAPTSAVFSLGTNDDVNGNTATFIAYLFATLTGVSKVGSYTGTGTTINVDCGFTNGARFVLIKRTDSTGDWYVWDTARGIVSGNDPYLLLNSTAAEVTNTDYIDPLSSGFQISSTAPAGINANGGSFIYLAIA